MSSYDDRVGDLYNEIDELKTTNTDLKEALNVVRGILPASGSIGSDYLHLIGNMGRDIIDKALAKS